MENIASYFLKKVTITCGGKLLDLSNPVVMGIINVTPDSFYIGSRFSSAGRAVREVGKMLQEGARIIDVGAYSSRPGAKDISSKEELARLSPVIKAIRKSFPEAILSVDTFRSEVARRMVEDFGVAMVNDISGGELDPAMFQTVADLNVPYILMHMKGNPLTMQNRPTYENLEQELILYFSEKLKALNLLGVKDVILDPGFGFGKTVDHNFELLARLNDFRVFDLPILAGFSRKSMVYKTIDTTPEGSLNGTTVLNTIALLKGVSILRVHDVKEAIETIQLLDRYKKFRHF
ncbi:dihydropteroate synthase [Williamwhitmania taraxaci]|uniref:dihydropteroate synthase n=1 Tax=Williamwhitmania taraxaci TaxID=1640674 RepID=A0A1G6JAD0_9BACT|nr:dihydropteroate synthase [Williamwhitmania taraxaci]SDC15597.1 dihydropteroate synthase [Williamwhitmania taraxaci]